jgi:hypothetical protein
MRRAKLGPAIGALVLAVASLPGGVAAAASKKTTTTSSSRPVASNPPAASGQIAYISGDTLEVQDPTTGQTTVKITTKTKITATVTVGSKAVTTGTCITATGTKSGSSLDATTVSLVAASNGKCAAGGRGTFVRSAGSGGTPRPARTSSTRPRFRFPANSATAFGKVTAVSGSTIRIEGTMFSFSGTGPSSPSGPRRVSAPPKATKVSVKVTSKTRYLRTGTAGTGSLKVGECATAFGPTSSIGAVTATRLSVSPATSAGCFGGFGGFGGSGPAGR